MVSLKSELASHRMGEYIVNAYFKEPISIIYEQLIKKNKTVKPILKRGGGGSNRLQQVLYKGVNICHSARNIRNSSVQLH